MKKIIHQYGVIPDYYAVAYVEFGRAQCVCYPIGIHLIIMFFRWLRRCVKVKYHVVPHDESCVQCKDAFAAGVRQERKWMDMITGMSKRKDDY